MPLSTTDAAAVEGFLRSRRGGTRELRDHVVASLLTYFTATNQLLRNLPTALPPREQHARTKSLGGRTSSLPHPTSTTSFGGFRMPIRR